MNYKKLIPLIGLIILIYLLLSLDFQAIISVFYQIEINYIMISFFSIIPVLLITNYEWQILLKKQKINVSFYYSLKNILIGYFYGFISPGGIGAYTRTFYLSKKSKAPLQKCVSNIVILNTIDYLSLLLLSLIGAIILSSKFPFLFIMNIIILIIVLFLFTIFLEKKRLLMLINKILNVKNFRNKKENIVNSIELFFEDIPDIKKLILPFLISILGWLIRFSLFFLISTFFFSDIPFTFFIISVSIANVIGSIPITIYGLGTREITLVTLLSLFNIRPEQIVSLSLFWFVIIWLLPSLVGALITINESRRKNAILG